ncbi:MAG: rhomboid family intramembrane serine protease [Flavobacteriales bacterium]|nr:rhomboid family intramembrane serine protease [Flavobacteriales bacterium]
MFWFSAQLFQGILGEKRLLGNYLLGGLSGFLFYALGSFAPAHLALGSNGPILGASAAVMSVLIGIASYRPDMLVNLFLIGPVKLKYVGIAILVLDLIGIREGGNTGGHVAHLGGALYGFLAARQLANGTDWSGAFVDRLDRIRLFSCGREGLGCGWRNVRTGPTAPSRTRISTRPKSRSRSASTPSSTRSPAPATTV